jgi:hypothetical protein
VFGEVTGWALRSAFVGRTVSPRRGVSLVESDTLTQ